MQYVCAFGGCDVQTNDKTYCSTHQKVVDKRQAELLASIKNLAEPLICSNCEEEIKPINGNWAHVKTGIGVCRLYATPWSSELV